MLSKFGECRFDQLSESIAVSEVHRSSCSMDIVAGYLLALPPCRVLDVGCATGHFALSVSPRGSSVLGVDPSANMLRRFQGGAAERDLLVETRQGRAENLPAADQEFDVILSRLAAHHFERISDALGEFWRVAKPGALLVIIDLEGTDEIGPDALLHSIELLHDPSHVRSYSASKWQRMLDQAGFDILESRTGMAEADGGLTVAKWCKIAESGSAAETAINNLLLCARTDDRAVLGIQITERGEFLYPVRTCMFLAKKRGPACR